MYCRLIAPEWLVSTGASKVLEGDFSKSQIKIQNEKGYNVYYLPNPPAIYAGGSVDGTKIDQWNYIFVDYDSKSSTHPSKDDFIASVGNANIPPSRIVDSGNGIHVYWRVSDLDVKSYQRLTKRMMRLLKTDPAVGTICQLMRLPGTVNTKSKNSFLPCETLFEDAVVYTCEQLDKLLPAITAEDEAMCRHHYDKTFNRQQLNIDDTIPPKFGKLLRENAEVKELWAGASDDRSRDDYRLGHLLFANEFSKEEAMSVLVNTVKAMARAPHHRSSYAQSIVDKIWTFEEDKPQQLSSSIEDILKKTNGATKGVRFPCHKRIDNTVHGFRLGQVLGLVAGAGVGKTAFALNMFRWFAQQNPEYYHFFIPLEQPANEIADRWSSMSGEDTALHKKIHVLSNYDDEGNFRHLSLNEIQTYILDWQKETGNKVGCVVIDHIGVLKKKGSNDENQDLMTICHSMKAFAVQTNTLLIMQSQTSREKAGIGDLELNKDAAYGTLMFEAYCDYLITLWQPLKRCHMEETCPTVTAFKFCKIRHKKAKKDIIQEDVPYYFYFDSNNELLRDLTQDEKTSFDFYLPKATNKRKADRKTELIEYKSVPYGETNGIDSNRLTTRH